MQAWDAPVVMYFHVTLMPSNFHAIVTGMAALNRKCLMCYVNYFLCWLCDVRILKELH